MSLPLEPSTLSTGQGFTVTLTLTKTGEAQASVTGATMDHSTSCTAGPVLPMASVGATATLTWTGCVAPTAAQTLGFSGSATWVDANVPGAPQTTSTVTGSVVVQ